MPKTSAPEWFLARVTPRDRAAAILGDLTEMSATRSRLWFWTAYIRTLISLGWRTPVAVLAAVVSVKYLRRVGLPRLLHAIHLGSIPFNASRLWAERHPHLAHLAHFSWDVSLSAELFLWIVFPYVAFRFGVRNRLTYLAGTLFVLALPVYTLRPQVYQLTGLACALVMVAALASTLWRRQMIFLAANYPVAMLVYYACYYTAMAHYPGMGHDPFPFSLFGMRIDDPVGIAVTVMICPLLYRWLLQPRPAGGAHAALA
jgi:hypothetical protein